MRVWCTPSLPLLPGPLWPGGVVLVRVPTMSQIDLYKKIYITVQINILLNINDYLKPYDCVQNISIWLEYLKLYNCVQIICVKNKEFRL